MKLLFQDKGELFKNNARYGSIHYTYTYKANVWYDEPNFLVVDFQILSNRIESRLALVPKIFNITEEMAARAALKLIDKAIENWKNS